MLFMSRMNLRLIKTDHTIDETTSRIKSGSDLLGLSFSCNKDRLAVEVPESFHLPLLYLELFLFHHILWTATLFIIVSNTNTVPDT